MNAMDMGYTSEEYKSTLAQLKDAKCEVEELKEELLNAYSKIKFLKLELILANVKTWGASQPRSFIVYFHLKNLP